MKTSADWKVIRWDAVKGLADNGFTRVVLLIPIAGYLILFNDQISSILSFDALAGVREGDASPFFFDGLTKLRFVFFGSLFVLLSFGLYRVFRPDVLDFSRNDLEFSEVVRQQYSVDELIKIEAEVYANSWRERLEAFWIVLEQPRPRKPVISGFRPDLRSKMFNQRGDYISLLVREYWVGMMHTYRFARVASLLCGVVGYLLLTLPTLDIAQAVLRHLLTELAWGTS